MQDIAVITYYNNFSKDPNLKQAFLSFRESIPHGVSLFVYESVINGESPELMDLVKENYYSYNSPSAFWNRENALNTLVNYHIPKEFKKIIWIDPTFKIENQDWIERVGQKLDDKILVSINDKSEKPFAFGAKRDFFEEVGIFDFDFSGSGGDIITLTAAMDVMQQESVELLNSYKDNNLEVYFRIISYNNKSLNYIGRKNVESLEVDSISLIENNIEGKLRLLSLLNFDSDIVYDKDKFGTEADDENKPYYSYTPLTLDAAGYSNQLISLHKGNRPEEDHTPTPTTIEQPFIVEEKSLAINKDEEVKNIFNHYKELKTITAKAKSTLR